MLSKSSNSSSCEAHVITGSGGAPFSCWIAGGAGIPQNAPPPRCPTCGLVSSSGGKGRKEGEGSPTPSTIVLGRRDPREPILHLHGLLGSHSKRSNLASPS